MLTRVVGSVEKTIAKKLGFSSCSIKAIAWHDGKLVEVWIQDTNLNGGRAKRFLRNNELHTLQVIRGKVYRDESGKIYFLENSR